MPHAIVNKDLEEGFPFMRIKYKDIFDLKEFYDSLHEYLLEHQWGDIEHKGERFETYYDERRNKDGGKELRIWWRLKKEPEGADYLCYYLDISYKCIAIFDTEVVREGHKLKMQKGEIELAMAGFIEEKYKKAFKGSIIEQFTTLFKKRIYKKTLQLRKKEFYQEVYAMNNFVKQWFKLKRYLPYEETKNFFPSAAYPSHIKEESK